MKPKLPTPYLTPYLRAANFYRDGFGSLLWACPETQAVRFDVLAVREDALGTHQLELVRGAFDASALPWSWRV